MSKFQRLAEHFIEQINHQKLPAGARLPALRKVTKQHQVSMTTATRAYQYLQQTGWIYARPQAGYFVSSRIKDTAFPVLTQLLMEQRDPKKYAPSRGYNPYSAFFSPLGTSMIAPQLLPSTALQRSIKRVAHRASQPLFQYPDIQGDMILRSALTDHLRRYGLAFSSQELVITNGCIDSVKKAIETLTREGDTIAIGSPCFSGLLDLLTTLSRQVIEVPIGQDGIDLPQFEGLLKQGKVKASLFSTNNINPNGISFSNQQKQALAELAARYQTPMIEDDVYFELSHQKDVPLPAKYWDQQGYVIWCGSFSKILAEGMRLGWCHPGRYFSDYMRKHTLTSFGVNGLVQSCMAEFINTGEYRSHVHKVRYQMAQQIHQYQQVLSKSLPENAKISTPQGGMVLWIQIPGLNTVQLEADAQQLKIDIRSGACFSTHDFYRDCFRINCGWPLEPKAEQHNTHQQLLTLCELIQSSVNK
ncbi:PLP-dependent aminotransferase family protein [Marinomonas sp. THO17]|uniref:aminotransferase-like domain-containing protein n=1 Tax=Marinomonas sp. THO17 TaxID=3149048 RepID=UPI00336BCE28